MLTTARIAQLAAKAAAFTVVAVTGGIGLTGTAHADTTVPQPPTTAVVEPATSTRVPAGYIAADGCHYYEQAGTTFLDACYNAVPGAIAYSPVNEDGTLGAPLATFEVDDPTWLYVRIAATASTAEVHARSLKADPQYVEVEGRAIDGTPVWVRNLPPQGQPGNGPGGEALNPADRAFLGVFQTAITDSIGRVSGNIAYANTSPIR